MKASESTYYIVSRMFSLAAQAHVCKVVPRYRELKDIFKGGIPCMYRNAKGKEFDV